MAARSISSSKTTDNSVGLAGVPMVKAVPILDTSDGIYTVLYMPYIACLRTCDSQIIDILYTNENMCFFGENRGKK
jgi:hypothetical protein